MIIRPILFSGPMVLALLEGRKTQTRRVITFEGVQNVLEFTRVGFDQNGRPVYEMEDIAGQHFARPVGNGFVAYDFIPNYAVGDLLWVREAWRTPEQLDHFSPTQIAEQCNELGYRGPWCPRVTEADNLAHQWSEEDGFRQDEPAGRLRPAMHMPRWASRLTLKVTDVQVQRVQDINEEDAGAEGWPPQDQRATTGIAEIKDAYPISWFAHLWDSLNEKRGFGWETNPWVVAITFEVHHCNVDGFHREVAA